MGIENKGEIMPKVKKTAKQQTEYDKLKQELCKLHEKWRRLPRRESFSGLHIADKIVETQNKLSKMGYKGNTFNPEINIEIG